MQLPSVKHPTVFSIKGVKVQLLTYFSLTESQARMLALQIWKMDAKLRRAKPSDQVIHHPVWMGSREDLAALEAMSSAPMTGTTIRRRAPR